MDEKVSVLVKTEITSGTDNHHAEELIVPDIESSKHVKSPNDEYDMARAIKVEPLDSSGFVDGDKDLENPYQCFECGLDCKSQGELIDHYESAHTEQSSRNSESNGNSCTETEVDDPLAGDVAPDSPEKAASVEGAQNGDAPYDVLLLYSCPCCGHTSVDWNHLVKHLEKHVQVTCIACLNCMYIFSSNYHLKDYVGRNPSDKPHVCCHCPFKTQWYQVLKDHCVIHHKNIAQMNSSNHHDRNCTPINDLNLIKESVIPTTLVQAASETNSLQQNSTPLAIPCTKGKTDCYVVLRNSTPNGQNVGNIAVPVQNFFPVIGSGIAPNGVNVIPQVLNVNPVNHLPASTVQKGVLGKSVTPNSAPKLETPSELNQDGPPGLPSPFPKSTTRTLAPKVPVDELLKKWSFTRIAPELPDISSEVFEGSPKPGKPLLLLPGTPPCRAPKRSLMKSRKGVKTKPCPYCSHLARDAHSLKTHILTHTKEKPFACEFCDYRATQRAHIKKHMTTHLKKWGRRKIPP